MRLPFKLTKLLFDFIHFLQKRRERGRISIKGIRLVEPAVLNLDGGDSLAPDVSIQNFILIINVCRRLCPYRCWYFCLYPFIDL